MPPQHASVVSVLTAQAKSSPTPSAVHVPAGGVNANVSQQATVWSLRNAHAVPAPSSTSRAVKVPAGAGKTAASAPQQASAWSVRMAQASTSLTASAVNVPAGGLRADGITG